MIGAGSKASAIEGHRVNGESITVQGHGTQPLLKVELEEQRVT